MSFKKEISNLAIFAKLINAATGMCKKIFFELILKEKFRLFCT